MAHAVQLRGTFDASSLVELIGGLFGPSSKVLKGLTGFITGAEQRSEHSEEL